jgi:hypothetical protein
MTMKFHSTAFNYLNSSPSAGLQPVETVGSESWQEDSCTGSSLDLGSESISDSHGSFEWVAKHHFQHYLNRVSRQLHRHLGTCSSRMPHHRGGCKVPQECPQYGTKSHRWKLQQHSHRGRPRRFYFGHPWIAMDTSDPQLF